MFVVFKVGLTLVPDDFLKKKPEGVLLRTGEVTNMLMGIWTFEMSYSM
jgi:hypothetical protein